MTMNPLSNLYTDQIVALIELVGVGAEYFTSSAEREELAAKARESVDEKIDRVIVSHEYKQPCMHINVTIMPYMYFSTLLINPTVCEISSTNIQWQNHQTFAEKHALPYRGAAQ